MATQTGSKSRLPVPAQRTSLASASSQPSAQLQPQPETSAAPAEEKKEPEKGRKIDLPPYSLPYKPKTTLVQELKKLKERMKRRHVPGGEDTKEIKRVLDSIRNRDVTVQEYIGLVAPFTQDNGTALSSVMNEDLNNFQKLARKVYETITQDNSDVLLNQQMQIAEFYRVKKALLNDKMMRHIQEIFMMAPKFNFDRYAKEKDKYLTELFPVPEELRLEPEEVEMMKRQAAYHRLQWLRSEGERLNDENNALKKRLNELKQMHREEQEKMLQVEKEAEAKKEELEAEQAAKAEKLEELNDSLEKSLIEKEMGMTETDRQNLCEPLQPKEAKGKKGKTLKKKRPAWNEEAAFEIDSKAMMEREAGEISVMIHGATSPFHYSPTKEECPCPGKETTPARAVPEVMVTPATEEPQRAGRFAYRPKDTWGGFH